MGGNAFKNISSLRRIKREDIEPTLRFVAEQLNVKQLDYDYLQNNLMGSAGKQESSGDLDIALNMPNTAPFAQSKQIEFPKSILKILAEKCRKILGFDYVYSKGIKGGQLNTAWPITGKPDKGYCQIDFIWGEAEWLKFSHYSPGLDNSPYKGVMISTLFGVLAKIRKEWQFPEHVDDPLKRKARVGWAYDIERGLKRVWKAQKLDGQGMSTMDPDAWETYVGMKWPESNPPRFSRLGSTGHITDSHVMLSILLGDDVEPKDIRKFEDLWQIVRRKSGKTLPDIDVIKKRFIDAIMRSSSKKDFNREELENLEIFNE